MKIVILLSFFVQNLLALHSNIFEDKQDAAKFLENSNHRVKRRARNNRPQCSGETLEIPGEFNTVKDWERVKDALMSVV